jgi:mannose-6-phosphate isomerase-like protein (cupin superfamily)
MLKTIAIIGGLTLLSPAFASAQSPAAGNVTATIVRAAELDAALKKEIAENSIDTMVGEARIPGGVSRIAQLHREKAETNGLIHSDVTEVYHIMEGSGTIVTGGSLENATPNDLARVGGGPGFSGAHKGGVSQHVGPHDVVIVPAGVPHRFSQLDGPISYVVFRFEPTVKK